MNNKVHLFYNLRMRIFIFLLVISNLAFGISFNLKEKILLDSKTCILQYNTGIALLDNGSILFSDGRACDFKIFNKKGELLKTFGRKGEGPDEFFGNYLVDYNDGRAVIMNRGRVELIVYEIDNKLDFIKRKSFGLFALDASMHNDKIVLCRLPMLDPNGTMFSCFKLDLETKKIDYLIPTRMIFGENPVELKSDQTNQMQDVAALNLNSYCDMQAQFSFMVWQGNWQVMKLDMNTKKLTRFGKKPEHYIQPYASRDLKQSFQAGNYKKVEEIYQNMSWMVDVIAWKEFIFAFYVTYDREFSRWQTYVQVYNGKEELLLNTKLEGLYSLERFVSIQMNKKSGQLIGLAHFLDGNGEDQYKILKYEIK